MSLAVTHTYLCSVGFLLCDSFLWISKLTTRSTFALCASAGTFLPTPARKLPRLHGIATKRKPVSFGVGDKVWCYLPELLGTNQHNKMESKWFGPFTIIERVGPVTYRLHTSRTKRVTQSFHVERLKPFWDPTKRPADAVILNQHFGVDVHDLIADPAGSLLPRAATTPPPSSTISWGSTTIDTYNPRKPTAAEHALVGTVFKHSGHYWKIFYVNYHLGNHCVTAWLESVTVDGDQVTPTGQTQSAPLQFLQSLIKTLRSATPP